MTESDDAYGAAALVAHARALYAALADELSRALRALRSEDEAAQPGLLEAIRAHRKALQTVLDYELQIQAEKGETDGALDLEAAREEIYRRLDRLAAYGAASGAD